MSEDENTQEAGDESSVIKQLRAQVKTLNQRLGELEPAAKELAFQKAGIDLESGIGKFFAEKYDGELDPDAIKATAEQYGIVSTSEQAQPADETQQRMDQLRSQSTPEGAGKRLSHTEWTQLSESDPQAAQEAHRNGLVDFPSHIAQNLAANRDSVRLGG